MNALFAILISVSVFAGSPVKLTDESTKETRETIRKTIQSKLPQLKACYEAQLKKSPSLAGKIVISFSVDDKGQTSDFSFKQNELQDTEMESCFVSELKKASFPPAPPATNMSIDYPFVFGQRPH
jgi:hypothetical protein